MTITASFSPRELVAKPIDALISGVSLIVFAFLDLLDFLLCFVYRFIDGIMEGKPSPCYCRSRGGEEQGNGEVEVEEVSETLYERKNIFREMGIFGLKGRMDGRREKGWSASPRWSDCGCASCLEWQGKGKKLHFIVHEPPQGKDDRTITIENVICIHGFLSSSSIWVETVFPNVSETGKLNLRMFALDLLGFGKSPKPINCMYSLKEHLEMIEESIIIPFQLSTFHLVAHSMGCIIAMALAAKYPDSVKSITIVAPPYISSSDKKASHTALNRFAERKVWPPLLFGSSVMTWYEHLGRTVCLIICRNHLKWEWIMKLLVKRRDICILMKGIHEHTHHSGWHTMHNVVCGGAKVFDEYLEVVNRAGSFVTIIQGDEDQVVPVECSYNIKLKVPRARLQVIHGADHTSVILGREKFFTMDLEDIWLSSSKCKRHKDIPDLIHEYCKHQQVN